MGGDDPVLRRLWKFICEDHGGVEGDLSGQFQNNFDSREKFLKGLCRDGLFQTKGTKVSCSRWFSWCVAHHEQDKHRFSQGMILLFLAMKQGWVTCAEDVLDDPLDLVNVLRRHPSSNGTLASAAARVEPGAASKASESSAVPAPNPERMSVKAARDRLQSLRARTRNTVELAMRLLLDADLCYVSRHLALFLRPQHKEYVALTRSIRSRPSCVQMHVSWSQWSWLEACVEEWDCLSDLDALSRAGIVCSPEAFAKSVPNPADQSYHLDVQDQYVSQMLTLLLSLLGRRCGSMVMYSEAYPYRLAGLLHDNRGHRMRSLQEL